MTTALLTPIVDLAAQAAPGRRRFWKQVLPVTSIDYNGEKIDFDEEFHKDLLLAHQQKAFDQVPLVFADSNNGHNMDPRNFGGDIIDLEYRGPGKDQGTWALIEADRTAARVIRRNPKLGVSARILQGVAKADGRSFKRAINHVLLTMNPRVAGMSPWQAVDLSEDADIEVVDLTTSTPTEGTDTDMGKPKTATATRRQVDLSRLNDEQFATLIDLATTAGVIDDADLEDVADEDVEDDTEDTEDITERPKKKKSKTVVTVEEDSEESGGDDEDDDEDDDKSTDLSEQVKSLLEANAKATWNGQRAEYLRAGVPPFMLDLAEPVLSQPQSVIDLSEGGQTAVDAMRKMLDGARGLVDLTGEAGHGIDLSSTLDDNDPDAKFLAAWDKQYG